MWMDARPEIDLFHSSVSHVIELQAEPKAVGRCSFNESCAFERHEGAMRGALVKRHVAAYLSETQGAIALTEQIEDSHHTIETLELISDSSCCDLLAVDDYLWCSVSFSRPCLMGLRADRCRRLGCRLSQLGRTFRRGFHRVYLTSRN